MAGIPLVRCILPEVIISLGSIPIAEYGTPSTEEIPDAIMKYLTDCDAVLLANHGALTVGTDLFNAYFKMETPEHFCQDQPCSPAAGRGTRASQRTGEEAV